MQNRVLIRLNEDELKKVLEGLLEFLKTKGFKIDENEKIKLIETITKDIKNENGGQIPALGLKRSDYNAFVEDLFDRFVKQSFNNLKKDDKKLQLNLNFAFLIKNILNLHDKDKKDQLKNALKIRLEKELILQLTKLNKISPNPKNDNDIKNIAKDLANKLVDNFDDDKALDSRVTGYFSDLLMQLIGAESLKTSDDKDFYRLLYGGMRPDQSSQQAIVEYVPANAEAFINESEGLATSLSPMDDQKRYDNDGSPDEILTLGNLAKLCIPTLVDELIQNHMLQPSAPSYKPYGAS